MKHLILVLIMVLSGCSTLDLAKEALGLSSSKGISVDAQVGDRENEAQIGGARGTGKIVAKGKSRVTVNTSTHSTASRIEKAEKVVINNTNPWVLGGLIATVILFIPTPLPKIIRGVKWLVNTRQRRLLKASTQKSQ